MKTAGFFSLLAISFGFGMSSCATVRNPVVPELAQKLKPGEGLIVATFSSKGIDRSGKEVPSQGAASVRASGIGSNKEVIVSILPQLATYERNPMLPMLAGTRPSDVIAIPVPAGGYEITGWAVSDRAVTADVIFTNRLPMKVPFQVRAGEATYVGRINSLSVYGRNLLGMKVPGEALVILSDDYPADAARIAKTYPSIRQSSIRKSNVPELYKSEMKRIANTPHKFFGLF